jgi:hypothetical protein
VNEQDERFSYAASQESLREPAKQAAFANFAFPYMKAVVVEARSHFVASDLKHISFRQSYVR